MVVWKRLIRFQADDGKVWNAEPILPSDDDDVGMLAERGKLEAYIIEGGDVFSQSAILKNSGKKRVQRLLGPLAYEHVPIIRCIGLNYMRHIKEAGRKPPPYPSLFIKPADCLADYGAEVTIPKIAQDEQCDYEGELIVVIGKDGKNIPKEDALDYVAGYVAGNDVSARKWQRDPAYAGGVPQWCFSKGFDMYAPFGPCIVSQAAIGSATNLKLETLVNGELRQSSSTSDLVFDVAQLISFLSQGTTLRKGSLIMTGTPSGVAMGMEKPKWLNHGDTVEVRIEKIGTLKHTISFE